MATVPVHGIGGDVADAEDPAVFGANDDLADGIDGGHAPLDLERDGSWTGLERSAWRHEVLQLQRVHDVDRRDVRGAKGERVHEDVDLSLAPPDEGDRADTVDRLELPANQLVCGLGHRADVTAILPSADADQENRTRARVHLRDDRWIHAFGEVLRDLIDLVASVVDGRLEILLELEGDDDLRDALRRGAGQLIDARDGVDRSFDLVGDVELHLLRRRAIEARGHDDDGDVDVGKLVDA